MKVSRPKASVTPQPGEHGQLFDDDDDVNDDTKDGRVEYYFCGSVNFSRFCSGGNAQHQIN